MLADGGRALGPSVEEAFVWILPKSSLLFFQIGHTEIGVGGFEESGVPMWRIVGEGQRQLSPKNCVC